MYDEKPNRQPAATHYVSISNGGVYPALRNVPGYEDDNPAKWRPATRAEIEAHRRGEQLSAPVVAPPPPVEPATPTTITLAAEDDDIPPAPPELLTALQVPPFPSAT